MMSQNARDDAITMALSAVTQIEETLTHLETVKALRHSDLAVVQAVTGEDPPDGTARRHALTMLAVMHRDALDALRAGRECVTAIKAYVEVL